MNKLLILSDLWGERKSNWLNQYITILENHFEIVFYDSCELAGIDLSDFSEDKIHKQFINGGIESAINSLLKKEKGEVDVLGFSIGGLIAWKAALEGLKVRNLFALSSTRLRYEEKCPHCAVKLFYAEKDEYKPSEEWFRKLNLEMNVWKEQEHYFYGKQEIAIKVSQKIIEQTMPNH